MQMNGREIVLFFLCVYAFRADAVCVRRINECVDIERFASLLGSRDRPFDPPVPSLTARWHWRVEVANIIRRIRS